ncbi:hypothetical protein B0T16DRAFT_406071 [Cercophora newfieldiana]|uniref:Uncharacterized protein n=1 Tax=Cercophora newfieldiana TaxID=92897 RepID=A0AA39YIX1_9PEZI|nr:hypothetical protein B0T16DRAFT_406071 [Cercophora newfieldiana]
MSEAWCVCVCVCVRVRVCRGWADSAASSFAQRFAGEAVRFGVGLAGVEGELGEAADSCELRCRGCDGATAQHSSQVSPQIAGRVIVSPRGWGVAVVGASWQDSRVTFLIVKKRRTTAQRHTKEGRACVGFLAPSTPSTVLM